MARKDWGEVRAGRFVTADMKHGYEQSALAFEFAEQVRQLREKLGLSQGELAERMGTTQSAISRLEAGGVAPNVKTLQKVAEALGAQVHVVLSV